MITVMTTAEDEMTRIMLAFVMVATVNTGKDDYRYKDLHLLRGSDIYFR